jgi:uncharacterized repeat protein (TIGR03806 family)
LKVLLLLVTVALLASGCADSYSAERPPEKLSAFSLFQGDPSLQKPASGVVPYALSTPLFSDYASKYRFVKLPRGQAARYDAEEAFDFPVGTVISKTFSYPLDDNDPAGAQNLIETRVLLRGDNGWVGLPYVWNEEQTDATLEVTGGRTAVTIERDGVELALDYRVPNSNQCKGCHRTKDREMLPIGPRAGLLNHDLDYDHGRENQLTYWTRTGLLQGAPAPDQAPAWPTWDDPESGSLDHRARAWLDINCAHCHNPEGPARTSGLDLRFGQNNPTLWGVDKSPVAAGRGAGDRLVDIAPGDPDGSILLYRLESVDPGEMMPELGRSIVHDEGIELIRQWIAEMAAAS